jgi:hypothetical protein
MTTSTLVNGFAEEKSFYSTLFAKVLSLIIFSFTVGASFWYILADFDWVNMLRIGIGGMPLSAFMLWRCFLIRK